MHAVVALRTLGLRYASLGALLSIRSKIFRMDALVLAIGGHWTILVVKDLTRLQVEGCPLPGYRFLIVIPF